MACIPPPTGESLQLLVLFSQGLPNISAKHLTSCIPLLECLAPVLAKETSHSGAPSATMESLSSICLTPFVCGLNCEPGQSLTVTRDTHGLSPALSSSGSRGDFYNKDALNSRLRRSAGDTADLPILGAQSPKLSSKQKLNHSTHCVNFHFLWLRVFSKLALAYSTFCTWQR